MFKIFDPESGIINDFNNNPGQDLLSFINNNNSKFLEKQYINEFIIKFLNENNTRNPNYNKFDYYFIGEPIFNSLIGKKQSNRLIPLILPINDDDSYGDNESIVNFLLIKLGFDRVISLPSIETIGDHEYAILFNKGFDCDRVYSNGTFVIGIIKNKSKDKKIPDILSEYFDTISNLYKKENIKKYILTNGYTYQLQNLIMTNVYFCISIV